MKISQMVLDLYIYGALKIEGTLLALTIGGMQGLMKTPPMMIRIYATHGIMTQHKSCNSFKQEDRVNHTFTK